MVRSAANTAPLLLLGLIVFAAFAILGWWAGSFSRFWRRLTPNPFVGDLLAQLVRVTGVVLGIVLALNLIGATTLMATVLGGAGVIGIALGFAVRDALENYISSIMLSLRQPFRANDHVVVDGHEGKVVRLTSRATILMTLDGNHLRIPNSIVFKAVILNYTRNPERRLEFELGVDANDDPGAAISTGASGQRGGLPVHATAGPRGQSLALTDGDGDGLQRAPQQRHPRGAQIDPVGSEFALPLQRDDPYVLVVGDRENPRLRDPRGPDQHDLTVALPA
jgi:hypothetical protein